MMKKRGGERIKGKMYGDEIRERAFALLAVNHNRSEVAKQLGVSESTLRGWLKADNVSENIAKAREENKRFFVAMAWKTIGTALQLVDRRLEESLHGGEPIPLKELSSYIGAIYDKAALASGEETGRSEMRITMSGELREFSK